MINIFTKLLFLILALTIHFLAAQTVEGVVTDVDANPIPYANIQIGNTGVLSNEEGTFLIHVENYKPTDSIKISYLGFEPKKFILKNFTSKTYILEEKINELTEVSLFKKKLSLEDVLYNVKKNLAVNYSDNYTKQQVFTRNLTSSTFKKFEFEFTKSTLLSKEQLKKTNESIHKLIGANIGKTSTSISEELSTYYVAKDTSKIKIIKAIELINKKEDKSQDALAQLLLKTVVSQLDKKATYKIKSGLFPVEDSLKVEDTNMYKDSLTTRYTKQFLDYNIAMYTFKEKSKLDFVKKTKKYNYVLKGMSEYEDEMVYIIGFTPKKSSAKFAGTMYVNAYDFAIVKLNFKYGKGKNGQSANLKFLLGVKFKVHTWDATVVYKKNIFDKYQLKFITEKNGSYVYMSRPFKFTKNRASKSESKKIIKLDVLMEQNGFSKTDLFFISSDEITDAAFKKIKQTKKYKKHYIPRYSAEIWKGYNVLSPIQEIKNYQTGIK